MVYRRKKTTRRVAGGRRLKKRQFALAAAGAGVAAGYGFYRNVKAVSNPLTSVARAILKNPHANHLPKLKATVKVAKEFKKMIDSRKKFGKKGTMRAKVSADTARAVRSYGRRNFAPAKFLGTFGNGRPFQSPGRSYGFNGSILKVESGGQLADAECLYLGHGVAFTHVIKGFFRAMLSTAFANANLPISDWAQGPFHNADNYTLNIIYRNLTSSMANVLLAITFTTDFTMEQMAGAIWTQWQASLSTETPFDFYNCTLFQTVTDSAANTHTRLVSTVFLANHDVEINVKSSLTIQNATLAGPVTAASLSGDSSLLAGREQMGNIYNNPLVGKMYSSFAKGNHWRNGFLEKHRLPYSTGSHNTTPNQSFLSDPNSGVITGKANTDLSQFWKKPPPSWAFEDKPNVESIQMNPAEMKKDVWNFHSRMGVSRFSNTFAQFLNDGVTSGTTSPFLIPFGFAKMIALEKRLDDRTEVNAINIHYEISQVYSIKLIRRTDKASLPIVVVNS